MCLQCVTNAEDFGEVLPGWNLMVARRNDNIEEANSWWKKGMYGLVQSNDPSFIFSVKPMKDPFYGMEEGSIDFSDKSFDGYEEFIERANLIERELKDGDLLDSWRLIQSAISLGYDPVNTFLFGRWFLHYLACFIESVGKPIKDE